VVGTAGRSGERPCRGARHVLPRVKREAFVQVGPGMPDGVAALAGRGGVRRAGAAAATSQAPPAPRPRRGTAAAVRLRLTRDPHDESWDLATRRESMSRDVGESRRDSERRGRPRRGRGAGGCDVASSCAGTRTPPRPRARRHRRAYLGQLVRQPHASHGKHMSSLPGMAFPAPAPLSYHDGTSWIPAELSPRGTSSPSRPAARFNDHPTAGTWTVSTSGASCGGPRDSRHGDRGQPEAPTPGAGAVRRSPHAQRGVPAARRYAGRGCSWSGSENSGRRSGAELADAGAQVTVACGRARTSCR